MSVIQTNLYPQWVTIEERFGKRLRQLRKKHKITQEELAERAEVDYKFYQSLEGKDPPSATLRTLEKLAKAFSLSVSQLLRF